MATRHLHFENFMPFCRETQECVNFILPWTQTLDYNNTCLFEILLRHNKIGMIRMLLENNMDPNQRFGCETSREDNIECTSREDNIECRSNRFPGFLFKQDITVTYTTILGSLYLCMATAQGNLDVVKLLLEKGATASDDTDDYYKTTTALMLSCLDKKYAGNNGHIEIFNLLLAQENNNYSIQNAFSNAVMCGYTEFVESILSIPKYKDLMLQENDTVQKAAGLGFAGILIILLKYGFPVKNRLQTTLHTIIESETQKHHDHGKGYAVVDKSNKIATATIILQWLAHYEKFFFYGDRFTVDTTDKFGEKGTPFFYAVLTCVLQLPPYGSLKTYTDNVKMIKLLVEHHADTEAKGIDNFSALKYILKFPQGMDVQNPRLYTAIIGVLVQLGCSTDSIDAETLAGHTDDVKLLFRNHWNQLGSSFKHTLSMRTKKSRLPELSQEIQDQIVANLFL